MGKNNTKTIWSDDELKKLIDLYKTTSNRDISVILNKTKKSIGKKLKELNIRRTKDEKDFITAKAIKKNSRDLTYDFVKEIAKKYNTKHEFMISDSGAYSAAYKNNWLDKICEHMVVKNISLPQLILKDILENILKEKCSFNDRKAIRPLEIDCYFPSHKIGWEYDGKYYHTDEKDEIKKKICKNKQIHLFNIKEKTPEFRNYELNIKNQLIKQIKKINKITGFSISKEEIEDYKPNINYPNVLTIKEKKIVFGKSLSEIKKIDLILFKRIMKYKIHQDKKHCITNDLKIYNRFKSIDEYIPYLIGKKYNSFNEMCEFEHPYRLMKRWNLPISIVKALYEKENCCV